MNFKDTVEDLVGVGKREYWNLTRADKNDVIASYIEGMTEQQRWEVIAEGDKTNQLISALPDIFISSKRLEIGDILAHIVEQYLQHEIAVAYDEVATRHIMETKPHHFYKEYDGTIWEKSA